MDRDAAHPPRADDRVSVLTIASLSLRRLSRDRTALFFVILLPVMIILIVGSATGGLVRPAAVGVVDAGSGPLAGELRTVIAARKLELRAYPDEAALRRAVRRGIVAAGVVIPPSYDARLRSGEIVDVTFLADQRQPPLRVRALVQAAVAEQGALVQAASFAARNGAGPFDAALGRARRLAASAAPTTASVENLGRAHPRIIGVGFGYQAQASLVLFVFITSLAGAGAIVGSRKLGITRRMLAAPTPPSAIVLGQTLGYFTIALGQSLFIVTAGLALFRVKWGDPVAAGALVALWALVGTGVGTLFGTLFRTEEQAISVGPPVGIALGMLGGCMWPLAIVPPVMRTLGHLVPHGWAMDAWIRITVFGAGLTDVARDLVVLTGVATALLVIATLRLRRTLAA
jgi:ABC-2 type transport system permease protein